MEEKKNFYKMSEDEILLCWLWKDLIEGELGKSIKNFDPEKNKRDKKRLDTLLKRPLSYLWLLDDIPFEAIKECLTNPENKKLYKQKKHTLGF